MTIYKNLWAGYDCFFVIIGSAWSSKNEPPKKKVLCVENSGGKWDVRIGEFYTYSLKDKHRYPDVGKIDLKRIIIDSFLESVEEKFRRTHDGN